MTIEHSLQIDLMPLAIKEVAISGRIQPAPSIAKQLLKDNEPLIVAYSIGKNVYLLVLSMHRIAPRSRTIHVALSYELIPTGARKQVEESELTKVNDRLGLISSLRLSTDWSCHVGWEYSEGVVESPLVLPNDLPPIPGATMIRRIGERITWAEGGDHASLILEIFRAGNWHAHLDYRMEAVFSSELASKVISRAQSLVEPFIRRREAAR